MAASEAILADSQNPDVLLQLATIRLLTDDLPISLQQTISVLRLDPDNSRAKKLRLRIKAIIAFKDRGMLAFKEGRWEEGVNQYADALEVVLF